MIEFAGSDGGSMTYRVRCTREQVRGLHALAARYFPRRPFEPFPNAATLFANRDFADQAFALFTPAMRSELRGLILRHGLFLRLLFEWHG